MEKPSLFIGTSGEGLEIGRAIQYQLHHDAHCSVWNEGVFGLSQGTLESLVSSLDRFDFAVLVITPDDVVISREIERQAPRDNIMFELGLFMGRLGRVRTFAVSSNAANLKLPSDLAGVTMARYDADHARTDATSAIGPACYLIRQAIRELGLSDTKRLQGIREAASQVGGVSDQVAHLVALMARSRILELEHIQGTFGAMLPRDFMERLQRDLAALEAAISSDRPGQI